MATTPKSNITTLDDPKPEAAKPAAEAPDAVELKGENHDAELSGDKVTLTVYAGAGEEGREDIFLGHNGYAYRFKRGVPHRLPREVAQVIADAVTVEHRVGSGGEVEEIRTPRYAYSITQ